MIALKNIKKSFGETVVLKEINLNIEEKEIVSIVGPSGAGKTTMLQVMGTLERPDSGEILIAGEDVARMNSRRLAQFRNLHLGFVFQFHHLLAEFTALENVMIPAMIAQKDNKKSRQRAEELLEMFRLSHRLDHKPHELSGGEQQRVAVARALINQPDLLLADEPSGNLDTQNASELHQLFFELRERFGQTIVIVTHNEHLAEISDRKIQMLDGRIVA